MRFLRFFLLLVLAVPLFADVAGNVQYIPLEKFPHASAGAQAIPAQPVPSPAPLPLICPCSVAANMDTGGAGPFPEAYTLTTAHIDALAALCAPNPIIASCPDTYSLNLFCDIGGPPQNLGSWEAVTGTNTCEAHGFVQATGDAITGTASCTDEECALCVVQITSAADYPAEPTCPQP